MGITLYVVQDFGVRFKSMSLLNIESKSSKALLGRCFNIIGDMQSIPDAADFREKITVLSSPRVKGTLKQ
jgi:hypothetical protein